MPADASECPRCGNRIDPGQKFCTKCGRKLAVSGREEPLETKDGAKMAPEGASQAGARGRRWAREPDDLGVRIDLWQIDGWLKKPLEVDAGTKAILIGDGTIVDVVGPGRYELKRFGSFDRMSAVLVDAGDAALRVSVSGLFTSDGLEVAVRCELVVQIADPTLFYTDFMKGRVLVTREDLVDEYLAETTNALDGIVGAAKFDDLTASRTVKDDYELQLDAHMRESLRRIGVGIVQTRSMEFVQPEMQRIKEQRSDNKLTDVHADVLVERARVREKLLAADNLERIAEMRSEADLEKARREIDSTNALDELEWQKMLDVARADEEDRRLTQEHVRRLLEQEREQELKLAGARGEQVLVEINLAIDEARAESEIRIRAAEAESTRRIEEARAESALRTETAKAKMGVELLTEMQDAKAARKRREMETETENESMRRAAEAEAETKIIEAQKDLTPDQILAMSAGKSDEAAKTLQEKYKADNAERAIDAHKHSTDAVERIATNAMESVANAASGRKPEEAAAGKVCKHCDKSNRDDSKFCTGCGKQLADEQ